MESQQTINNISLLLNDIFRSNFITMFKKKYGMPPNKFGNCVVAYRKNCHGVLRSKV